MGRSQPEIPSTSIARLGDSVVLEVLAMSTMLELPSTQQCPGLLSDLRSMVSAWDEIRPLHELIQNMNQLVLSHDGSGPMNGSVLRRTRMSPVRYQKGSIEQSGDWYYVRFRMEVPGRKKRKKMRERICPVKGTGSLSDLQRTVKAQQIVDASGVNDAFFVDQAPNPFAAVTFRERGDAFLREVAKRKRKPIASRTLDKWQRSANNWLYPTLGEMPLSKVNNASVKPLISKMSAVLKPGTIGDHVALIKRVVASAVNSEGEQIYPRKWNHDFMDLPCVVDRETNTPSITPEIMSGLARWRNKRARTLFILCGASGLRVGEALGLDLAKHFSEDFRTLRIDQKAVSCRIEKRLKTESSYREIDLDPRVAAIVKTYAKGRTSGLLFCTRTGKPIGTEAIYRGHLHPALKELGFVNEIKGNHQAGMHIFRRFRETHLGKCEGLPRGIRLFWMGHAEENMTDHYDKIKEDRPCRRQWAEDCGLGFELPALGLVVPISRVKSSEEDAA